MQFGRERLLTLIKTLIMCFISLAGGTLVAGGVVAFITMIGVIPRLSSRTNTIKYVLLYENVVMAGGILGNLWSVFEFSCPIGAIGLIFYGLFAGVFIGCLSIAVAEVLDVIPVFALRVRLKKGMAIIVVAIALGKGLGSLYQLVLNR